MFLRFLLILFLLIGASATQAAEYIVKAKNGELAKALQIAKPGDILRLASGIHSGSFEIEIPLTLIGEKGAKIVGTDIGSPIIVTAPNVTIKGLEISGSGSSHETIDSGVRLLEGATNAIVENNKIIGNLVGVDIHGPKNALVKNNIIIGRLDNRMNDRGNGIYIWNTDGARVIGNDIRYGRDGIFVTTSKNNQYSNNRFRDLRFGVHYMYAHNSEVSGNISMNNHLGYAIMFSKKVIIKNNYSFNDRDYGIMLNYTNSSIVEQNIIQQSAEKCVFIYNSHKNNFSENIFEKCDVGTHFTAGSERNTISNNSFSFNRTQVKYVGSKWVDWSESGRGNFWSDHAGFDLNSDGIADNIYRPNDVMDRILWTQPAAKSLMGSPAVQLIKWSQSAFPALLPGGVIDKFPLMQPIKLTPPVWKEIQ